MLGTFEEEWCKIEYEYNHHPVDVILDLIGERRRFVVFSWGVIGQNVARRLVSMGANLVAVCDNFKTGFDDNLNVPVIPPEQLINNYRDAVVVIAVSEPHNTTIYNQLIDMGFEAASCFQRYDGMNYYDLAEFKSTYYTGYKWAYEFFSDIQSKSIILNQLRGYLFCFKQESLPTSEQYFDNFIELGENEVFVDCGGYIGDTSQEFIKRTNGKYRHIFCFEPNKDLYEITEAALAKQPNVDVINKGVFDKTCDVSFGIDMVNKGRSRILDGAKDSIKVVSLDEFFDVGNCPPTFIKMDIEGSEKEALIGCAGILTKRSPQLAICVYHKPEDIYELPKLLYDYGYNSFILRKYNCGQSETVMYAKKLSN